MAKGKKVLTFCLWLNRAAKDVILSRSMNLLVSLWGGALRDEPKNGCKGDYELVYSRNSAEQIVKLGTS